MTVGAGGAQWPVCSRWMLGFRGSESTRMALHTVGAQLVIAARLGLGCLNTGESAFGEASVDCSSLRKCSLTSRLRPRQGGPRPGRGNL